MQPSLRVEHPKPLASLGHPRLRLRVCVLPQLDEPGVVKPGPRRVSAPPFDAKAKREFASALDRALTRLTR